MSGADVLVHVVKLARRDIALDLLIPSGVIALPDEGGELS
jgi:hypothetical protein